MIKQKNHNEIEQKMLSNFYDKFQEHNFITRTERLKELIPIKLGTIPVSGLERGKYFIKLNKTILDVNQRKFIKKLLTIENINSDLFFSLFPAFSINEIEAIVLSLERDY